jgi:hypothetical protein
VLVIDHVVARGRHPFTDLLAGLGRAAVGVTERNAQETL